MRGSRKSCKWRSNSDVFVLFLFLVDEGGIQSNTKSGPSSDRQRNTIYMVFRWRAYDGPTLNTGFYSFVNFQGIRTSIAENPYIFVIFQGRGVRTPCPPPPTS